MSGPRPIRRLLVANRGEVASRVFRACRAMGIETVAVFSEADRAMPFVHDAGQAVAIGGHAPADSYLRASAILDAARRTGADAIHPGYGFLAESAAFARACLDHGFVFVGPRPESMAALGSKLEAKRRLARQGVPVLPWVEIAEGVDVAAGAERLGYPVLVKAAAGGGGRGMRVVTGPEALADAIGAAGREAASAFGDGTVFLEPYLERPRHVEVQVLGDVRGQVVSLFERECSVQRRHQKLIEESPSPAVHWSLRQRLGAAAVTVAQSADYIGAGTVEFLVVSDTQFFFLEMNTRLQVEHPVTEAVTGLDVVRLQLLVAQGEALPREATQASLQGHAIEARLYAEDPVAGDRPAAGRVSRLRWPDQPGVRVDAGIAEGTVVGPDYDALLAKVIAHAPTRAEAAGRLASYLERVRVHGLTTNRDLLVRLLRDGEFLAGDIDTGFLDRRPELRAPRAQERDERLHAAAAALASAARRRAQARVLGFAPAGWRNNPCPPSDTVLEAPHGIRRVSWLFARGVTEVAVDGDALAGLRVHACTEESVDLEVGGVRRRYEVHLDGEVVDVDSALGHTRFREQPRFTEPGMAADPGSLRAPLPGRVTRIAAEAGVPIAAGDLVLVLEAMKMEHRVTAPAAGVLREVRVAPGAQVEAGAVLAVIGPAT